MTMPTSFTLLTVLLPPMLLDLVGVKGESCFVGPCYCGTKPRWTDGKTRNYSFYHA